MNLFLKLHTNGIAYIKIKLITKTVCSFYAEPSGFLKIYLTTSMQIKIFLQTGYFFCELTLVSINKKKLTLQNKSNRIVYG